jgi:3-hydroxyisobutyrate dehydrogenase-like beta-hydroxyacid dehydrogenase
VSKVAVVGLGAMGRAFAGRLLATGHEVVVWNRSPGPVDALVAEGAKAAGSPADAAAASDFVITMISDPAALQAVTDGPDGILAGARAGCSLLQMATVGPAAVHQLAQRMPAEVELVDCPVLGSISEAEGGTLSVFIGGDHRRAEPVLSSLGRIVPVGEVGAGSAAKLVANSTLFGLLSVLGEAVALGDGLGLPRDAVFDVLAASPIAAQAERRRGPLEANEFPLRFALALARKDADLVLAAAADAGVSLPVAAAARGWFDDAVNAGRGGDDYSAVLAHIAAAAPP